MEKEKKERKKIFVTPKKDVLVRHPENLQHALKAEGEWVYDSVQWQRYIRFGDVTVSQDKDNKQDNDKANDKGNAKKEFKESKENLKGEDK